VKRVWSVSAGKLKIKKVLFRSRSVRHASAQTGHTQREIDLTRGALGVGAHFGEMSTGGNADDE
jgi:hypothetical protein